MELSFLLKLVNVLVLLVFGSASVLFGKIVRMRTLDLYAFLYPIIWIYFNSALSSGGVSVLGTPTVFHFLGSPLIGFFEARVCVRAIMYLFLLVCTLEILRREYNKLFSGLFRIYVITLFILILISVAFPYIPNFSYFVPRIALFLFLARYLKLALTSSHFQLFALTFFGAASLIADMLIFIHKIAQYAELNPPIDMLQDFVTPSISIISSLILLYSIIHPYVKKWYSQEA